MNKPHWAYVSKEKSLGTCKQGKYSQSESILILLSVATHRAYETNLLWKSLIKQRHQKN